MATGNLFWFAYTLPAHTDREQQPFQLRDGEAARCLTAALIGLGYRSEGCIINYPSKGPDVIPFDLHRFGKGDLILVTTRPPIHDMDVPDKKGIPRSYTALEQALFAGPLARVFDYCARSQIILSDLAATVSLKIKHRQVMLFRQNGGAAFQAYRPRRLREFTSFKRGSRQTAAFLVYVEEAWEGGPALLAAFGVGGTETLVWCRLLQTRYAHLLGTTSFVMAEMRSDVPKRPQTLDFADDWHVEILGTAPLGFLGDPAAAA
jgi:hypothetical protein